MLRRFFYFFIGTYLTVLHAADIAYVTSQPNNSVTAIDIASETITDTITVGTTPTGLAFSPDGTVAYVSNNGDGTISVIDVATSTVTATITVGGVPTLL